MALDNWAKNWSASVGSTGESVATQYHADAVRWDASIDLKTKGTAELVALAQGFLDSCPDAVCEVRNQLELGDTVIIEWTWTGTHTGDMEGWPATGKKVVVTGCNVIELDGGLIRNERSYFDYEGMKLRA